jgi:DNA-binding HxlR family transcriptional regulator
MRTKRRSPCPVACTLDLIGDKWTLLVVRDLMCGKTTFKEFSQSPEKIATNILTDRLDRLVTSGLAQRRPDTSREGRETYHLTPAGQTLFPVLKAVAEWGLRNLKGTKAHLTPQL